MAALLIDRKATARTVLQELGESIKLQRSIDRPPGLAAILVGDDPASEIYVRNKARQAVELFSVMHGVDSLRLVEQLAVCCGDAGRRPRILIQVNVAREAVKNGAAPEAAAEIVRVAAQCREFELVGLMTAPDGFFREMVSDGGGARTAIADLQQSAASLRRLTAGLEDQEGLLGRLLQDPEYSAKLAGDLETTLSNVAEITDKINRGEGTLGALVNERTLYDGAEDVVAGVDDSKFARWLTRHYRKKGIKAQEQEAERAAKAAEGD